MKKILIIGGTGYIGSALDEYLSSLNRYDINLLDIKWFGNYTDKEIIYQDYKDFNDLNKYDVIILLAGHSSVKMANDLPSTFNNNVRNFIELVLKLKQPQKLIYASSSGIYGNVNRSLIDEDCCEYTSGNYYDLSKYEIDSYIKLYNNIEYYGLRFGTLAGPSVNFRNDIMINMMYESSLKNKEIKINNLNIRRPILGINDLCFSIEKIIEEGSFEKRGLYNLASFNSTVELIGMHVAKEMDVPIKIMPDTKNVYDFAISTKKFESNFNFIFKDTVKSLVSDIRIAHDAGKIKNSSNRNNLVKY